MKSFLLTIKIQWVQLHDIKVTSFFSFDLLRKLSLEKFFTVTGKVAYHAYCSMTKDNHIIAGYHDQKQHSM